MQWKTPFGSLFPSTKSFLAHRLLGPRLDKPDVAAKISVNMEVPQWFQGIDPSVAGYGSVAAIGVMMLIIFRLARRIVAIGYFVLYFFIGFAIVYSASAYTTKSFSVPLSIPIVGGLAFSAVASAIRAKLMRIVSAVMMVALFSLAGKYWSQYAHESAKPNEEDQQLASKALSTARKEFGDIQEMLPRDAKGRIKAGFLSDSELKEIGVDPDLKKTTQKPLWHTILTGLFDQETHDLGIWTPGGSVEQAKKGLKLRPEQQP